MRVLVACEFSGRVRDAFAALGHDAWSCDLLPTECDLLPTERRGNHYQGDVFDIIGDGWDLLIGHPPCTHLAVSGAHRFKFKAREQAEALDFVRRLMDAPVLRHAIENPVSVISTAVRPPDQIIQPWQFGHGETKTTCLWLKGLPPLVPTRVVESRAAKVLAMAPSRDRWARRSRTYPGIAEAMAMQWGGPTSTLATCPPSATASPPPPSSAPPARG